MNLTLGLAGLHLAVSAPRDLPVSLELAKFAVSGPPDITVELSWDWNAMPQPQGEPDGGDDLQVFYLRPGCLCCVTKGGWKGPLAACWYWPGRRRLLCLVNAQTFPGFPQSMDSAFSLLPMRAVLMDQGVVFLHAARISAGGRGILFCGPSGMGKTTQATLWQQYPPGPDPLQRPDAGPPPRGRMDRLRLPPGRLRPGGQHGNLPSGGHCSAGPGPG